jgi:hypothetical protein
MLKGATTMRSTAPVLLAGVITLICVHQPAAAKPDIFDSYSYTSRQTTPPAPPWEDAAVETVNRRSGMISVVTKPNGAGERTKTFVLPFHIRADHLPHKPGDNIRIQVILEVGHLKINHVDGY